MTTTLVKMSIMRLTLKLTALSLGLLLATYGAIDQAQAQPTLDRVEQQIRRDAAGNPVAGDPGAAPGAEPGYLGLIADDRQDQGRGVRILDVVADGPAAKGGLETGDLITAIDGRPVKQMADMGGIMSKAAAGQEVEFLVSRNNVDTKINVTLTRRPAPEQRKFKNFGKQEEQQPPAGQPGDVPADAGDAGPATGVPRLGAGAPAAGSSGPKLGVRTLPITDDTRARYQLPSNEGAFVAAVTVGSPAAKAGIPAGSVITSVDGEKVTMPEDLAGIVKRAGVGKEVELTYFNRGQEVTTKILLTAGASAPTTARPRSADLRPALDAGDAPAARPGPRDGDRISELEARVRELEDRLQRLESGDRGR